jgi:hypothetical protein
MSQVLSTFSFWVKEKVPLRTPISETTECLEADRRLTLLVSCIETMYKALIWYHIRRAGREVECIPDIGTGKRFCPKLGQGVSSVPNWERSSVLSQVGTAHQLCPKLVQAIDSVPKWDRVSVLSQVGTGHQFCPKLGQGISSVPNWDRVSV